MPNMNGINIIQIYKKQQPWLERETTRSNHKAGELVQQARVLALQAWPPELNSRTGKEEGEKQLHRIILPFTECCDKPLPLHAHT